MAATGLSAVQFVLTLARDWDIIPPLLPAFVGNSITHCQVARSFSRAQVRGSRWLSRFTRRIAPPMDLPEYVQSLSFRIARPDVPRSVAFRFVAALLQSFLRLPLDQFNTRLPCDTAEMRRRLGAVRRDGRENAFAVGAIINRAVTQLEGDEAFAALGVGDGFPLFAAMSGNAERRCVGIDDFGGISKAPTGARVDREKFIRRFEGTRSSCHHFFERTIDGHFAHPHDSVIGFCFISAREQSTLPGRLRAVERHLAENALLLVENANCTDVFEAVLAFIESSRNQYRILLDGRARHHGRLTFGDGILLFQLLGRNQTSAARSRQTPLPALAPAA